MVCHPPSVWWLSRYPALRDGGIGCVELDPIARRSTDAPERVARTPQQHKGTCVYSSHTLYTSYTTGFSRTHILPISPTCLARAHVPCIFVNSQSAKPDVRSLLKQRAQEKATAAKVDHPLAKYNAQGQLSCSLCHVPVASAAVWPAHLRGRVHKQV